MIIKKHQDETFLDDNNNIADSSADNNNSALFKSKTKIASRIGNNRTKTVEIMVPWK